jgi:hypothetical protein
MVNSRGNGAVPLDQAVVHAAAGGDSEAWDSIVDRLSNVVWNAASVVSSRTDHVRQVYHLTWLRLADHLHEVDAGSLSGWLVDTARREANRLLLLEFDGVVEPETKTAQL